MQWLLLIAVLKLQMFFTFQLITVETEVSPQLHLQDLISQDQVFYIYSFKLTYYMTYSSLAAVYIRSCIFYTKHFIHALFDII